MDPPPPSPPLMARGAGDPESAIRARAAGRSGSADLILLLSFLSSGVILAVTVQNAVRACPTDGFLYLLAIVRCAIALGARGIAEIGVWAGALL